MSVLEAVFHHEVRGLWVGEELLGFLIGGAVHNLRIKGIRS
jgi:hypothetical protein